ncbi:unnamed protein product [Diamesa serratosioi]
MPFSLKKASENFSEVIRQKRSLLNTDSTSSDSDDSNYKPSRRRCIREEPTPYSCDEVSDHESIKKREVSNQKYNSIFEGNIEEYKIIEKVGEGSYGKVYKARHEASLEIVALKNIRRSFLNKTTLLPDIQEIEILTKLNHKNIVILKNAFTDYQSSSFYMCFEFMEYDLMSLLESGAMEFNNETNANIMKQVIEGIHYCHIMKYIHRDIKTSNILVNSKGVVKIADFGLAIKNDKCGPYSNHVVTLWYRSPELLFGEVMYDEAIDVWSLGCVLGELFALEPIFPGSDETSQLDVISSSCGTTTKENCPSFIILPFFNIRNPKQIYPRTLRSDFAYLPAHALDLMDSMLTMDPRKRTTLKAALLSPWFNNVNPDESTLNVPTKDLFYNLHDTENEST